MPVLNDLLWLVGGLAALYFGAEWLVGGASSLAVRFGISPLVVGLTVVAFGTSAPELFVSISFNLNGHPGMSLGNVVGSNICNIALVLGISAFICFLNIKSQLIKRDLPVLLIATIAFTVMLWNGQIGRIEGGILFAAVVGYTWYRLVLSRKIDQPEVLGEFESEIDMEKAENEPVWKFSIFIVAGLVGLYFGAKWLETGGVGLAEKMGVPKAVISLTLIAFSTSVPELATSIIASLKKQGDIITGNVIGSCIFNLLCVIGLTALVKPLATGGIEMSDLYVMIGLTVVLCVMMFTGKRITRWEGGLLLLGYGGYCTFLYFDRVAGAAAAA